MPRNLWSNLAKGAAGFLLGLAFWWALSAPYARLLATLTEPLIRAAERPPVTRLIANGRELTIDRDDFPRASPRPGLLLMDLTSNIILLTTLFAVNRWPLSDRNAMSFVLASLALVVVHIAAVVMNVESIYALRLGPWSAQHYGPVARNFWGAGAHFYSIVGVFGAAFALWWLFRPSPRAVKASGRTAR
ncbi:MAG TPA: hypothetical protein VNN08_10695 [Thermoanaerobaculia bacterium]|nr:hypothetical protein [Thermoanaerobaculia bacterium]